MITTHLIQKLVISLRNETAARGNDVHAGAGNLAELSNNKVVKI